MQSHLKWTWFYCQATDRIIQKKETGCISYRKSTNATRNNPIYITSGGMIPLPPNLVHTTVIRISPTLVKFGGTVNENLIHNLPDPALNLPRPIVKKKHIFWMLTHSNITTHIKSEWIKDGLIKGNLRAVCDGSFKQK